MDKHINIKNILVPLERILENDLFYYGRGIVCKTNGEYNKAIANFSRAIKHKPDYIEAYYERAIAYYEKGNRKRGRKDACTAEALIFSRCPQIALISKERR